MSKLIELWKDAGKLSEKLAPKYPSKEKKTIPTEWIEELKQIEAESPPKLAGRVIWSLIIIGLGIFCVASGEFDSAIQNSPGTFFAAWFILYGIPVVAIFVNYFKKNSHYNELLSRGATIRHQIREIESNNSEWDQCKKMEEQTWAQIQTIYREAARLMNSKEYFEQVFSSANTQDLENELHYQCLFMEVLYHEGSDYDFAETYLLSSVNPAQDVVITDSSIVFRPTSSAWSILEQASGNSRLARILYYVSLWKMNGRLRYYCGELMLDKSVVPSVPLDEFLAQHDSTPATTGTERDWYKTVSARGFDFIDTIVRALIIRILQNRHLKDSMVATVERKMPEPSHWAVIYNGFVPRMMEISNGYKGKIDHSDDDFFASRPYRRVHAGRAQYFLYPGADKKTACNVPDTVDGLPVIDIMEDAFEEVPLLQILFIPKTIKDIGRKIFSSHAIPAVIHVCYSGTSVDWNKIRLSNNWAYIQCGHVIVHCTDTSFVA